jgi:hypothetical protein
MNEPSAATTAVTEQLPEQPALPSAGMTAAVSRAGDSAQAAARSPGAVTKPIQPAEASKEATQPFQETDAWWGAYSGWTMLPSMLLCLGLTAFIAWASWRLVERGWLQLSVFTVAGALWLAQAFRWCYRVFGYNYRLTTRRLFHSKGILYQETLEVPLETVRDVAMRRQPQGLVADTGNVSLTLDDAGQTKVILEGVTRPRQVADLVRALAQKARERQVTAARI